MIEIRFEGRRGYLGEVHWEQVTFIRWIWLILSGRVTKVKTRSNKK